jgi:hypothetical protein
MRDTQWWLDAANLAYLISLFVGFLAAGAIAVTSWLVIKWQADLQQEKDTAFAEYKLDAAKQIAAANAAGDAAKADAAKAGVGGFIRNHDALAHLGGHMKGRTAKRRGLGVSRCVMCGMVWFSQVSANFDHDAGRTMTHSSY